MSSSTSTAVDYIAIQNTIARYCIALDSKNFELFRQVFVEDVEAKFPYSSSGFNGVENVAASIEKRLRPVTSQHAITTQHIEIAADGKTAKSTSYFTGIHFGQGKWEGMEVTAWGQYIDDFVCVGDRPTLPGASGAWLIAKRNVTFFGRRGEEGVMDGEGA